MKRLAVFFAVLVSLLAWSPAGAASAQKVTLSPATVAGGGTVKVTVTLASKAPGGGELVTFASSSSYADLSSASVRVAEGRTTASVTITTNATSTKRAATVSATAGGVTRTATLTIEPVGISSVKASPALLTSDSSVLGTVTLNGAAPSGGYAVALSENSSVVDTPSSVTVPAGAKAATFPITSEPVTSTTTAVVTASAAGLSRTTSVTVSPLALSKVAASTSLTGGNDGTGKVTFNGLTSTDGATVALSSSLPSLLEVPETVTAPAGVTTAAFPVTTSSTTAQRSVVITATYRDLAKTFTVTVNPVAVSSIVGSPRTVVGSQPAALKVSLTAAAPPDGVVATLTSSDPLLSLPEELAFDAGVTALTVPVETRQVTSAKVVTLAATVNGVTKTTTVTLVPIAVTSILLNASPVGGNGTVIDVGLNAPAPAGGATVALESSDPSLISLPETIELAAGERDVEVEYVPAVVSVATSVNLSATYGAITKTVTVTIEPGRFLNFGLAAGIPTGGRPVEATFALTGPASEGGVTIALAATVVSPAGAALPAELPASVFVPAGERSLRVAFNTTAVAAKTVVAITGSSNGKNVTARLTVDPPQLQDFNPRPIAVRPGDDTRVVVRLTGVAPAGGVVVSLVSTRSAVATVPASVTVPAGSRTATVNVSGTTGAPVGAVGTIKVTALGKTLEGGAIVTDLLLAGLTLSAESVVGGNELIGTVTLNGTAPAGGAAVGLEVIDPALSVPGSVLVPAGQSSATFTVTTYLVDAREAVVVYARFASSIRTADLSIGVLGPISLEIDDDVIEGGRSLNARVTLNGDTPPSGGAIVDARVVASNGAAVHVPATVAFARSSSTATFVVTGVPVAVETAVTLVVEVNGQTSASVQLTVRPPRVQSVAVAAAEVIGGTPNSGTVHLTSPAPAGGWRVALSSSSGSAVPSGSVTVPAGATSKGFSVTTSPVAVVTYPVVTAECDGTSGAVGFTINPPRLVGLAIADGDLEGGFASTTGTVSLNGPAPADGWSIALASSSPGSAGVPPTVTVAAGATSAAFSVGTSLVPADAEVTVTASKVDDSFARAVTVRQIKVTGLSLSTGTVQGGTAVTATVTINRPVPSTGVVVNLADDSSATTVAATVTVPVNRTSATFSVSTVAVAADAVARITVAFNGGSTSADLAVLAPVVSGVSANPTTLVGGWATVTGTVTLSHAAPAGGFPVTLDASNGGASVPATVTVASGATTATFTVSTAVVSADRSVTIKATRNGVEKTTVIVVQPLVVSGLSVGASTVLGGDQSTTATLTLNGNAPAGGAVVTLSSSHPSYASVPAAVTVPAGTATATFAVTTVKRSTPQSVTVTATYNEASRSTGLQVNAPAPSSLGVSPGSVIGGGSVTGTVTLNSSAPTGGLSVSLATNSLFASVPSSVTVAAGATTATFTVSTFPIAANSTVTVTATANGVSRTATFTVGAPTLTGVSLSAGSALGGTTLTATATISSAAPAGGLTITMSSDRSQATPANVVIAAGQTSGTASVTTQGVTANTVVTITGSLNGASRSATFTINKTTVASISVNPTAVVGGGTFGFTVTLNGVAPAGGLTIAAGDNSGNVHMPGSVFVTAGSNQVTISVGTNEVGSDQTKQVGITYDGVTYYTNITLLDD